MYGPFKVQRETYRRVHGLHGGIHEDAVYLFLRLTYHSLISRPEVRSPKGSNSGTEAKFSQTVGTSGFHAETDGANVLSR